MQENQQNLRYEMYYRSMTECDKHAAIPTCVDFLREKPEYPEQNPQSAGFEM